MTHRTWTVGVVTFVVVLFAAISTQALVHVNNVTFGRTVALPNVQLPAGSYTFELLDATAAFGVVRVWSARGDHVFYSGIVRPVERPRGTDRARVIVFEETAAGATPAIKTWYPLGSETGYAFFYHR